MKQVLISAGHSDVDPGALAYDKKTTEASLAVELRNLIVAEYVRLTGQTPLTDGSGTSNQPLPQAIALARGCAHAVEIHFNSAANPAAAGVEAISLPEDKAFAQKLAACVSSVLGTRLRGEAGWISQEQSARGRLGFVNAGGVILEVCFLSNQGEVSLYQERKGKLAAVIAGVLSNA